MMTTRAGVGALAGVAAAVARLGLAGAGKGVSVITIYTLRKATSADNLEISRISVEGWRYAYKGIMPDTVLEALNPKERAANRVEFLTHIPFSTSVCFHEKQAIGFVDFALCRDSDCDKTTGEVWAIYVLPEFIGKGIGKMLMHNAEKSLAIQDCTEIVVWVLSKNLLARTFYERQGFTADGAEKKYQGLSEIRYRKTL